MKKNDKFLVKARRCVEMSKNPFISMGFLIEEYEEVWIVKGFNEDAVLGLNPETDELRIFPRNEIREIMEMED